MTFLTLSDIILWRLLTVGSIPRDVEASKMKLTVLAVILSCCLVQVYCDCSAAQIATVRQQWDGIFASDPNRPSAVAMACFQRSAPLYRNLPSAPC